MAEMVISLVNKIWHLNKVTCIYPSLTKTHDHHYSVIIRLRLTTIGTIERCVGRGLVRGYSMR